MHWKYQDLIIFDYQMKSVSKSNMHNKKTIRNFWKLYSREDTIQVQKLYE